MTEKRPALNNSISLKDFKDFYWLKEELISFCKKNEITHSGGKIEITNRIIHFLETGDKVKPGNIIGSRKSISKFDWSKEKLSLDTLITDNYKNTENVRSFFSNVIGSHFKFNALFMRWMKQNVGETLETAVAEWNRIYLMKNDESYESEIDPQFEYNTYMRDFLKDNPHLSAADARKYWMLKRNLRGSKKYTKDDLLLS
jgi:hypothetical protein